MRGDAGRSMGPNAFTLADSSSSSNQLLVLSPSVPSERHDLTISGAVRTFTSAADLRAAAPWLGSTGSTANLEQFRNQPVIIADSIRTTDGRELVSGSGGGSGSSGSGTSGSGGGGLATATRA